MSNNKQYQSAIKWTWIIFFTAMTSVVILPKLYPNYYFMKGGDIRGNRFTGTIEYLHDSEWVNVTESEMARIFRTERKKRK